MSLTLKTILYYFVIAIFVFSIGGIVVYRLISQEIAQETDYYLSHSLEIIETRLERAVERGYNLNNRFNTNQMIIKELSSLPADTNIHYSDTLAMHPHLNQLEMMRKLNVAREVKGKFFDITIIDVIVEDSDIYDSVVQIIIRLFALFALATIIGTFLMSRSLLQPFKETLENIKKFKVMSSEPIALPATTTKEFSQLNKFLREMTSQAQQEYQILKKFSENASHEMQTPLAIAAGKLDLLTDSDNLTEEQFGLVTSAQRSLKKLSQLGQSLSLLSKIENHEFSRGEKINVSELVDEALLNFKELFDIKNLSVTTNIQGKIFKDLNPHLATILINNLFHNAIRHNIEGGRIRVIMDDHHLTISNTGAVPEKPTERMFDRFEKNNPQSDSTGLGLAIVKEICDFHNIKIDYTYNIEHQINIYF